MDVCSGDRHLIIDEDTDSTWEEAYYHFGNYSGKNSQFVLYNLHMKFKLKDGIPRVSYYEPIYELNKFGGRPQYEKFDFRAPSLLSELLWAFGDYYLFITDGGVMNAARIRKVLDKLNWHFSFQKQNRINAVFVDSASRRHFQRLLNLYRIMLNQPVFLPDKENELSWACVTMLTLEGLEMVEYLIPVHMAVSKYNARNGGSVPFLDNQQVMVRYMIPTKESLKVQVIEEEKVVEKKQVIVIE